MDRQYYPTPWKLSLILVPHEGEVAAITPLDSIHTWICLRAGMVALIELLLRRTSLPNYTKSRSMIEARYLSMCMYIMSLARWFPQPCLAIIDILS